MDIGRLFGGVAAIGGAFYAGFKFNDYLRRRHNLKVYEDGLEVLKVEIREMESKFHDAADSVKKSTKDKFDALMKRIDLEITRPEKIEYLRRDIRDFIDSFKS